MKYLLTTIFVALIFSGCVATREDVERMRERAAQIEQSISALEKTLPALQQAAEIAKEKAEQSGSVRAKEIASQASSQLAQAVQDISRLRGIASDLKTQADNTEPGTPWAEIALGIIGTAAAGWFGGNRLGYRKGLHTPVPGQKQ